MQKYVLYILLINDNLNVHRFFYCIICTCHYQLRNMYETCIPKSHSLFIVLALCCVCGVRVLMIVSVGIGQENGCD